MNNKTIISIAVVAIVVVGAGAFYGGTIYEKKSVASARASQRSGGNGQFAGGSAGANGQQARGQRGPNGNGGGFINGKVTAKDDKSITVQAQDGSSKIVYFSNSTTIGKSIDGSATDLTVGNQVMVNGQTDASGIITAQIIQIRPNTPIEQNK